MSLKHWVLLGASFVLPLQDLACSNDFKSCYTTRTCPPTAGSSSSGEAGANEAGAPGADAGGAGEDTGGTSGVGGDAGDAGATAIAGSTGGTTEGRAGNAGSGGSSAGSGGSPPTVFDTCHSVSGDGAPKVNVSKGTAVSPTLTNGLITPGKYFLSDLTYYNPGNDITDNAGFFIEIAVEDNRAAIQFDQETWVIVMASPPSSAPQSVKVVCSENGAVQLGVESKNAVAYQADASTFQLLLRTGAEGQWNHLTFKTQK